MRIKEATKTQLLSFGQEATFFKCFSKKSCLIVVSKFMIEREANLYCENALTQCLQVPFMEVEFEKSRVLP